MPVLQNWKVRSGVLKIGYWGIAGLSLKIRFPLSSTGPALSISLEANDAPWRFMATGVSRFARSISLTFSLPKISRNVLS